jgi:hypothetical protein
MAVKPLLNGLVLTISDSIEIVSDRVYVRATATISDGEHSLSTTAFAREALVKKGMDESQITGSASSYARKYALNGLLLIDDNKDADTKDNREETKSTKAGFVESSKTIGQAATEGLTDEQRANARLWADSIIDAQTAGDSEEDMYHIYESCKAKHKGDTEFLTAVWNLLDSKIRSSIKKTGAAHSTKEAS